MSEQQRDVVFRRMQMFWGKALPVVQVVMVDDRPERQYRG